MRLNMDSHELRDARVQLGLKQQELANAIGMSAQAISFMERGRMKIEKRTELSVRYLLIHQPEDEMQEDESWVEVPGYEGLYRISTYGRVFSYPRQGAHGGFKKAHISTSDGYWYVNLHSVEKGARLWALHILVARAFIGEPPEKHEVSHEDGDRTNPRLSNLKYRTRKDNISLTEVHGTKLLGERTNSVVLTDVQVLEIKKLTPMPYDKDLGYAAIARRYGVDPQTIADIFKGKHWKHIAHQ